MSDDSDIPEPTREELLNLAHYDERQHLESGDIPAKNTAALWADLRRRWDEGHKQEAERRRQEEAGEAHTEETPKASEMDAPTPDRWLPKIEDQREGPNYWVRLRSAFERTIEQAERNVHTKREFQEHTRRMEAHAQQLRDNRERAHKRWEQEQKHSAVMLDFFERVERYRGHLLWVGMPLRIWWVVIFVFGIPYGGGLAAMFGDQWLIAIALFLAASAVLAVKGIVDAKDREQAVLVLILAGLFWFAHLGWVIYTHKQFTEKAKMASPAQSR